MGSIKENLAACRLCASRFAATATAHAPRPVVWFGGDARILIAGQAPGLRVHETATPFQDRSGDRLREWMGVDAATFYDRSRVAIVPMAFCFPGYTAAGADLPPPPICAHTWRKPILDTLGDVQLTLLVGGYAQAWHLEDRAKVTERVANWRSYSPAVFALPHPSWRNNAWIARHRWFEDELLPALRARVAAVLAPDSAA
ncbi:MAG: uracil-DNA glycosylase family protein [Pseudomonadota bacterium]